jgi:hypothetical protein
MFVIGGRMLRYTVTIFVLLAIIGATVVSNSGVSATTVASVASRASLVKTGAAGLQPSTGNPTLRSFADQAYATLLSQFYDGNGGWRECTDPTCGTSNRDWGVDSLTYTLFLRWVATGDSRIISYMDALSSSSPVYPPPCKGLIGIRCTWSDAPNWDAVAELREYEVSGGKNTTALARAEAAFDTVERSDIYSLGACPAIRYQQPFGYLDRLKTLETEATAIKAATLLYRHTGIGSYLVTATARYLEARKYFLDPATALYSVFVFDDGKTCVQVPHRFFASVNGEMISNGVALSIAKNDPAYLAQALETARAVDANLSDARGVFADLLADNDIVEPLIEAMYVLAVDQGQEFARQWLLRNAQAAVSSVKPDGTYGRVFDGPPPPGMSTPWSTNGGLSLMIAAGALAPLETAQTSGWANARSVPDLIITLPHTLRFYGSGIALMGALGDIGYQPGHARVFVDGRETVNGTGIWQNSSSALRRIPGTVLFAWQWPTAGSHTIGLYPGVFNLKEGFSYLHVQSYLLK